MRNAEPTKAIISRVSAVKRYDRKRSLKLHCFGMGKTVKMNIISSRTRNIPAVVSGTVAGLINASTRNGILTSPAVMCTKTRSCQMTTICVYCLICGGESKSFMTLQTTTASSVSNATGKMIGSNWRRLCEL